MLIFKIFRRPEWEEFRAAGSTDGAPVDDLVLAALDAEALGEALKWETSRGGALFPHLYRQLRMNEVIWDKSLPLGATGHIFPEGVI